MSNTKDTSKTIYNILIVDDRPENVFSLESMLEDDDRFFFKAFSGNEALKIAYKENLSLILLDVQMAEMNGFETAELLKSNTKTKNIPIIFVTAINKETKYILRGLDEGAIDYLFKPLDTQITRAKVSVLLKFYQQTKLLEEQSLQLKQKNEIMGDKSAPIIIIKATDDSSYGNLINILDEMAICNIGRYAIVDIAPYDLELLKKKTNS